MPPRIRSTPRTNIERAAARQATDTRARLSGEIRIAREDAGLSLARLASACGLAKGHLHAIEAGRVEPRWETLARLGTALGMSLSVRLYPESGPLIRDHIQAAMVGALLRLLHEPWQARLEVPVYRPVRGVIDVVLEERSGTVVLACEAHSELRRLEQQIRWSRSKADALGVARQAGASTPPSVGRLLLLRSTARTRATSLQYADVIAAAYPARTQDIHAALSDDAPWPGDGLIWCRVEGGEAVVLAKPPRGILVGR